MKQDLTPDVTRPILAHLMIGTALVESLVQAIALTHRIKGYSRASLLLLAAPESGKTTIATAATCAHVERIAVITGRSVAAEMKRNPRIEFLLFNDLSSIRAMSAPAVNLLIVLLNQLTQDERGVIAFAGKERETIDRPAGIIGCLPYQTFVDHRARWRELGFVSRMIPFAYSYPAELVAVIKDGIDVPKVSATKPRSSRMPKARHAVVVAMSAAHTRTVRHLADARAAALGQLGLRLLSNYHVLIRAHALLNGRRRVVSADLKFLRAVDEYVSVSECKPIDYIP